MIAFYKTLISIMTFIQVVSVILLIPFAFLAVCMQETAERFEQKLRIFEILKERKVKNGST